MAERRMFAKSIVLSDAFLDMPLSARCLYFTLGMLADDDGFVGSPKSIMRQCGASQDDMVVLLQKRFLLAFESGVIVIKHWKINNYLQNDRHKDTTYVEELETLALDKKGAYTEKNKDDKDGVYTECIQDVYTDKDRLGKDRIDKGSNKNIPHSEKTIKIPPTLEEVEEYCKERNNGIDAQRFIDYYESKGWTVGRSKMKDWKAAVRTWEKNQTPKAEKNKSQLDDLMQMEL